MGSFFSFLVGIISPMILSRVFSKADYGTFKQVMYVYNTLLMVFTLGLPKAYSFFLPKYEKKYSKDIINKITFLFIGMGLLFSVTLFTGAGAIAKILNNSDLSIALRYFAPTPLFLLPTIGLEGIYAAFRKTQYVTIYTIVTRFLTVALTVLPVFFMEGSFISAIVGFDIASFLMCLAALFLKSYPVRNEVHQRSELSIRQILQFSLPLMVASLWGVVIGSASQFFISRFYGNEVFADFSNGFMEIPIATMVISSVATVLLPRFSEMSKGEKMNDEVFALWKSAMEKSAMIIFPILVFSVAFSRLIMICLYGDAYSTSAVYFMIKNIGGLLYIIPFAPIILAIGKTKMYANIHMLVAFMIVLLELICVKTIYSPIAIAIISEFSQILKVYLMIRVISHFTGRSIKELVPIKSLSKIFMACLTATLATLVFSKLISINKYLLATICLSLFCLIYFRICKRINLSYKGIISSLFPGSDKLPLLKYLP